MGLPNIQHNIVIEVPRCGLSFEVNASPVKKEEDYVTYSLSSSRHRQISFRHDLFLKAYSGDSKLVYSSDSVITNGPWILEHKKGLRVC